MRDVVDVDGGRSQGPIIPFGKEMRKQFLFQDEWRNLNHGKSDEQARSRWNCSRFSSVVLET